LIALFSGTPWTWNGSWSNLAIITTRIAYTARSMARHPRNVPAHPYLLLPRLVVTLGSSIAAVSSRHQLPLDWQFAPHRLMFEAAGPAVFAWYIQNHGAEVNLFVDHSQIVQLECLRSRIWGTKTSGVAS
jgi:(2R)-phospho-3-sulfolactate synthase (ComA)